MISNPPSPECVEQTIDCFWETFPPTWSTIRGHIREIVTEYFDISVEQFHILRHIRKGYTTISELAAAKHISRPAVSQAVNALVAKNLVTRQHGVKDRRSVSLELTQEGSDLLNFVFQKNREWMVEILSTLNDGDLDAMRSSLELIKRIFDQPEA